MRGLGSYRFGNPAATAVPAEAPGGGGEEQPPEGDPYWAQTVFLAGFDDGSLADESLSAHVLSSAAILVVDEESAKFGAQGAHMDGGHISAPTSSDWQFGSAAFTLEGWFNWTAGTSSANRALLRSGESGGGQLMWRLAHITGALRLSVSSNGTTLTTTASGAWAPIEGQWHHLAADFDGTAYRVYADGVMVGKSTSPLVMFTGSDVMRVGGLYGGTNGFAGDLDELRITKGVARYASDGGYSVPVAAFPRE